MVLNPGAPPTPASARSSRFTHHAGVVTLAGFLNPGAATAGEDQVSSDEEDQRSSTAHIRMMKNRESALRSRARKRISRRRSAGSSKTTSSSRGSAHSLKRR